MFNSIKKFARAQAIRFVVSQAKKQLNDEGVEKLVVVANKKIDIPNLNEDQEAKMLRSLALGMRDATVVFLDSLK